MLGTQAAFRVGQLGHHRPCRGWFQAPRSSRPLGPKLPKPGLASLPQEGKTMSVHLYALALAAP